MSYITAIIVSKDRACQLDALLQSIDKYAPGIFKAHIIYKSSNQSYQDGYNKMIEGRIYYNTPLAWWPEITFKSTILSAVEFGQSYDNSLCCELLTDDSIYFRPFTFNDSTLKDFFNTHNCKSFAPRCGFNTQQQCHWAPIFQKKIEPVYEDENIIKWKFSEHDYGTDYGRPISLDGNIHPIDVLYESMINNQWNWCGGLDAMNTEPFQPYISSYKHSILTNIPANSTHGAIADNWGKHYAYSFEELNAMFLKGYRLDIDNIDFSNVIGGHQEFEFKWK